MQYIFSFAFVSVLKDSFIEYRVLFVACFLSILSPTPRLWIYFPIVFSPVVVSWKKKIYISALSLMELFCIPHCALLWLFLDFFLSLIFENLFIICLEEYLVWFSLPFTLPRSEGPFLFEDLRSFHVLFC